MDSRLLIEAIESDAIIDIYVICATNGSESVPRYHQAQSGPLAIQLNHATLILTQPEGQEDIHVVNMPMNEWCVEQQLKSEEYTYATFSVFELFGYRRSHGDLAPQVDSVVAYMSTQHQGQMSGLVLSLSTGGMIGIDASSDAGLRFFLDRQHNIFLEEYATPSRLSPLSLWKR